MLNVFRENLRSLKWVLLVVVASFVVTIFAVWGGGATGRSGGQSWAASVDGRTIPVRDVLDRARNLDNAYRQFFGAEQYEQQRQSLDLIGLALERLIEEELLVGEGRRLGLGVTDRELQERIRRDPALQENGAFIGRDRYLDLARSGAFDARRYEEGVRRDIMIKKVRGLLGDGIRVSGPEVLAEFRRWNEKISVSYLVVSPEILSRQVEVSDAEVEETYRLRREAYREPEKRTGAWIELPTREVGADIHPTDEQLRLYYEENLLTDYTLEDQRRARHILFRVAADAGADEIKATEEKARGVLERIRAGEDFAALAREFGEDGTAAKGGDLGYFGRERMVKKFSDAVWSLDVGEVADLVRTQFGFHIVQLLDLQEKRVQSFEEVRERIRNIVRFQMTLDETARRLRELRERMDGAAGFEREAAAAGFEIRSTGAVTADGEIEGMANSFLIVRELFQIEPGEVTGPIGMPDGQALVLLREIVPGEIPPLEAIRERVEQDARREKARGWAERRAREAGGADPPAALADFGGELGVGTRVSVGMSRGTALPELPETTSMVERAFDLPEGGWLEPQQLAGGDLLFLQVTAKQGNLDEFEQQRETLHRNLILVKRETHYRTIVRRLREQSRIVRNNSLLSGTRLN